MQSNNKPKIECLPQDWDSKKIGDFVTRFVGGASLTPNDFTDSGVKVLPKKGIQKGGKLIISETEQCYTSFQFAEKNQSSIVTQEFLITVLRDLVPTAPSIGLIVKISSDERYILAQGVYGMIMSSNIDSDFLIHYSNSPGFRSIMKRIKVGSTQVHIRNEDFFNVPVPYPPIEEQRKIAEILSTIDDQIELTDQLIEKTTLLKNGLMQHLLLKGIGHTEFKKSELGDIPSAWRVLNFGDFITLEYGFSLPEGKRELGPYPVLGSNGVVGYHSVKFVSAPGIVLGRKGSIDKVNFVDKDFCPIDTTYFVNNRYDFDWKWLFYVISMQDIMKLNAATGVPSLNRADFYTLKVPIPPITEQREIGAVLSDVDVQIGLLSDKKHTLQNLKRGLMQKLLTGKIRVKV